MLILVFVFFFTISHQVYWPKNNNNKKAYLSVKIKKKLF